MGTETTPPTSERAVRALTPFQRDVAAVVRSLSPGEMLTYGEVAAEAGHPGSARAVGGVLRRVEGLAWWRVVPATGRLHPELASRQRPLLEAEGHVVDDDRLL